MFLFSLPWVVIAFTLATLILPGLQISFPAILLLSLVILAIQTVITAGILPILPKLVLLRVLNLLDTSHGWLAKLQKFGQSWLTWFVTNLIGYGIIWGLLWLAQSFLPGVKISDPLTLFATALIVFYFPQAAQKEFGEPLKTLPVNRRSLLTVLVSIITFPLIPWMIATLGSIIPHSGLMITPLLAAVTYGIFKTMWAVWASILKQIQLSWAGIFPHIPNMKIFLESLPPSLEYPCIVILLIATLAINIVFGWLSTRIVPGISIRYPYGLVTFALAGFVGALLQGIILMPFRSEAKED
ncbi:hypothetical protein VB712_15790 [Spirulina sp. CCNP1310]|uniref:hypothetical protein n=1 Tax=Spirulina sp. CCNP1310 TaxID=3110249 RepID=UPI002B202347|nr:hypothetical protein [Spirulina sp. CCNP1310]MEA5420695.1 hypothetical protein [Spirulina sp. CCNP1310]